jgi:ribosome modulation factor
MKRQKRDRLERAQQRGYQAGIAGRSKEMCYYEEKNLFWNNYVIVAYFFGDSINLM